MQRLLLLTTCFTSFVLASLTRAQTTSSTPPPESIVTADVDSGTRELIISGVGASNKDFDDSSGGFNLSLGQFYSPTREVSLRQSVTYVNPNNDDSAWNGSTKFAFDQHFGVERFRPFLGVNVGYVYGEAIRDTWAAGIEGGVKYYVQPRTFIAATVDYGWFFQHADTIDNRFDDGQYTWSLGVGFNF